MKCEKCGQIIADGAAFCANCGTPVPAAMPTSGAASQPVTPMAASRPVVTPAAAPTMSSATVGSAIGVNTAGPVEEPKKKLNNKMVALIAVSVVCLVIGIVGIILAVANSGDKGGGQIAIDNNGEGGSTTDVVSSGTKVAFAGYEFVIPKDYEYEIGDVEGTEALAYSNDNSYAAATMYFNDVTFARLENNVDVLAKSLGDETGVSVTSSIKTAGGVKFICLDFGNIEGTNLIFAVSDADLYYFKTVIMTEDGSNPMDRLEDVAKVVGSAQKKTSDRAFGEGIFEGMHIPEFNLPAEETE